MTHTNIYTATENATHWHVTFEFAIHGQSVFAMAQSPVDYRLYGATRGGEVLEIDFNNKTWWSTGIQFGKAWDHPRDMSINLQNELYIVDWRALLVVDLNRGPNNDTWNETAAGRGDELEQVMTFYKEGGGQLGAVQGVEWLEADRRGDQFLADQQHRARRGLQAASGSDLLPAG